MNLRHATALAACGLVPNMSNADTLSTHLWARNPRYVKQGGKVILLRQCSRCGRDFAKGLDGFDWCPVYLGAFKAEPLGNEARERWLNQKCPRTRLLSDDVDRGIIRR